MSMPQPNHAEKLSLLAQTFAYHAEHVYASLPYENRTPLYRHLSLQIVNDPDVLLLFVEADNVQQVPNLLFTAVHFLLLGGVQDALAAFYRSLNETPRPPEAAYPVFRAFCLKHASEIQHLIATRRIQTNEVRRCACLLPAFEVVFQQGQSNPLALIEIGPSAGLNLLWDTYGYDYGQTGYAGDRNARVQLHCIARGKVSPPIPQILPPVISRVGIDLIPLDVRNEEARRWLQALVWPEHRDRATLFARAVEQAQYNPPMLLKGSVLDLLPAVLNNVPEQATICIFHSFTLNQTPAPIRERILGLIAEQAARRSLFRISYEWYYGQEQPALELFHYQCGQVQQTLLAYCEGHGLEIEWFHSGNIPRLSL